MILAIFNLLAHAFKETLKIKAVLDWTGEYDKY